MAALTFIIHTIVATVLLAGWGFGAVMLAAHIMERRGRE